MYIWNKGGLIKFGLLLIVILATIQYTSSTMMHPQRRGDQTSVAEAIKYLQELDSIYSQMSRPRIQIRSGMNEPPPAELETAIQLLRLETIDRIYSKYSKPRFGKRAGQPGLMERDVKDSSADQEENWKIPGYLSRR